MANATTVQVLRNDKSVYKIHMTCIGDGSGEETNIVKVDRSTLLAVDAAEPSALQLDTIRWGMQGITYVKLSWDHDTDDTAMVLDGHGYDDFTDAATAATIEADKRGILSDPASAGGTGDLLLTTSGLGSGDSYDITLSLRLAP